MHVASVFRDCDYCHCELYSTLYDNLFNFTANTMKHRNHKPADKVLNILNYTGQVSLEDMFVSSTGLRWAFLMIDNKPYLACEEDA